MDTQEALKLSEDTAKELRTDIEFLKKVRQLSLEYIEKTTFAISILDLSTTAIGKLEGKERDFRGYEALFRSVKKDGGDTE